jgi:AcrR family transcriptional regulator
VIYISHLDLSASSPVFSAPDRDNRGRSVTRSPHHRASEGRRDPDATRGALIDAARKEFEESGFDSTQSNKIARRAGFAPQTFYRHFIDKVDILLAVYARWVGEEQEALDAAKGMRKAARALLEHHRASLKFRRALRALSVTDKRVRTARANSRLLQIAHLRELVPHTSDVSDARLARSLFVIERVADACAEGEFADLRFGLDAAEEQLVDCLRQELALPSKTPKSRR